MTVPRSSSTFPLSDSVLPSIIEKSVVLPAPLGPTRPIRSPRKIRIEMSVNRVFWPKPLLSFEKVSMQSRQRFADVWKEAKQKTFKNIRSLYRRRLAYRFNILCG